MKLSREEIKFLNGVDDINKKKNIIQNIIIEKWWATKKGIIECYTGFGKGTTIAKLVQRINREFPEYDITILSPTNKLQESFDEKIIEFGLKNTKSITIQSYNKIVKAGDAKTDVLIVDEAHRVSNEASIFYSEIMPQTEWKFFLACSATFDYNHTKYFKDREIDKIFSLDMEDGVRLKLVPDYTTYCIGVNFTKEEQAEYIKLQKEYDNYVKFFSQYDFKNPIGAILSVVQEKNKLYYYDGVRETSKQHAERIGQALNIPAGNVIGVGMKWMNVCSQRMRLLNNSFNLLRAAEYILKNIVKDPIIVFCSGKDNIKYLSQKLNGAVEYHSGISDKTSKKNPISKRAQNLLDFEEGRAQYLLTIKAMDEGYDNENLRLGLQYSYSSKKLQFVQRNGRISRYDPNNPKKQCFFICLYIEDFDIEIDGIVTTIESQQKKWLQNSLKGRNFVEWITLKDLKL